MSGTTGPAGEDRGSLSAQERVVRACDRFEAAWRGGQRPRIEDHLAEVPEPERPALLRELLALELELRRGERPDPQEYRDRFPDRVELVAAAFEETELRTGGREIPYCIYEISRATMRSRHV